MTLLRGTFLCCVLLCLSAPAAAKPPPAAAKLFAECVAASDAGRYGEAVACFQKVFRIYPAPVVLYNIGLAEERLGRLVEAYENYQRCLTASTEALTPVARRRAEERFAAVTGSLGHVRVKTDVAEATVFVDGRPQTAPSGASLPVLPGTHEVRVEATGRRPWREVVTVKAGETRDVVAQLAGLPAAGAALRRRRALARRRRAPPPRLAPNEPTGSGSRRRLVAWTAAGTAAAALVAGVVCSVLSSSRASDGDALLAPPASYPDVRDELESARSDAKLYGGVAIGMYALAAVGAGTAVYLFVTSRPRNARAPRRGCSSCRCSGATAAASSRRCGTDAEEGTSTSLRSCTRSTGPTSCRPKRLGLRPGRVSLRTRPIAVLPPK